MPAGGGEAAAGALRLVDSDWKRGGRKAGCAGQERDRLIPTAVTSSSSRSSLRGIFGRIPVRHRIVVSLLLTLAAFAAVAVVVTGRRGQFSTALLTAPIWLLGLAALLHITSLITRSEAWNFCMRAAGGSAPRRVVFRAAGVGSLASVLSAQLGVATRIGALRRTAPNTCPRLPTLAAAEVPIVAVEATLAAVFMFTLVGPLHLPFWVPILVIVGMLASLVGLRRLARRRRSGIWLGLAALRELRGRERLVALVVLGVLAQVGRNLLVLHAVGVNTSVFNAIAVLIISVSLSPLPVGAGVGATATVLILGAHGLAATAAGGVLLTVTGTVGALCYATWACGDHMWAGLRGRRALGLGAGPG
jgi:uncharacterized membrane protein YbhN (UPF0104 family)